MERVDRHAIGCELGMSSACPGREDTRASHIVPASFGHDEKSTRDPTPGLERTVDLVCPRVSDVYGIVAVDLPSDRAQPICRGVPAKVPFMGHL